MSKQRPSRALDKGAATEHLAAAQCMLNGHLVCWPSSERCQYDFVVDTGTRLHRIQVKSAFKRTGGCYQFSVTPTTGKYVATDVDFYILYIYPIDEYYVIPFSVLDGKPTVRIYESKDTYQEYREAWYLLDA